MPSSDSDQRVWSQSVHERRRAGIFRAAHMPDNREQPGTIGQKGEADTIDGAANEAAGKATQKLGKKTDDDQMEAEGKFQKEQGKAQKELGEDEQKMDKNP